MCSVNQFWTSKEDCWIKKHKGALASSAPAPTYPLATHLVLYNQYKIFKYHSAENRSTCLLNSNFQTDNMTQIDILRCSCPEMFYKNVFLKVVQNSHENICARDFRCIFLNFATFLRTLFLKNTSWWVLLMSSGNVSTLWHLILHFKFWFLNCQ